MVTNVVIHQAGRTMNARHNFYQSLLHVLHSDHYREDVIESAADLIMPDVTQILRDRHDLRELAFDLIRCEAGLTFLTQQPEEPLFDENTPLTRAELRRQRQQTIAHLAPLLEQTGLKRASFTRFCQNFAHCLLSIARAERSEIEARLETDIRAQEARAASPLMRDHFRGRHNYLAAATADATMRGLIDGYFEDFFLRHYATSDLPQQELQTLFPAYLKLVRLQLLHYATLWGAESLMGPDDRLLDLTSIEHGIEEAANAVRHLAQRFIRPEEHGITTDELAYILNDTAEMTAADLYDHCLHPQPDRRLDLSPATQKFIRDHPEIPDSQLAVLIHHMEQYPEPSSFAGKNTRLH